MGDTNLNLAELAERISPYFTFFFSSPSTRSGLHHPAEIWHLGCIISRSFFPFCFVWAHMSQTPFIDIPRIFWS
jgi:hypothetical protein